MKAALGAVLVVLAAAAVGCGGGTQADVAKGIPASSHASTPPLQGVPCFNGHQHIVDRKTLTRFHAVTAVRCTDGMRTYPGQGQWWAQFRQVAVGSVSGMQRYFEQPDEPPYHGACTSDLALVNVPTFVDSRGHWVIPHAPVDGCNHPIGYPHIRELERMRWRTFSVRKVKLQVSAKALAAHCSMGIKDLPAGGIGELSATSGGPLFQPAPKTVRVCIYRTPANDFEVGNFVRGFRLNASQTQRLLGAMTGGVPSGSCPNVRTFAWVGAPRERWAEVELGGCWRVGRTRPNYGLGSADPAVVSAILAGRDA